MAKKTITVDGIKMHVDTAVFEDWDFYQDMVKLMSMRQAIENEQRTPTTQEGIEQMDLASKLMTTVFGDDFDNIKDQIRKKNGGFAPVKEIVGLLPKAMNAAAPKNS